MLNKLLSLLALAPERDDDNHEALIGDSAVIAIARALAEHKENMETAAPEPCSAH